MTSRRFEYQGNELELFALAVRWKAYIRSKFIPYLGTRILEVGAGFGAMTRVLLQAKTEQWTCLEPDSRLACRIVDTLSNHPLRSRVEVICGTAADLKPEARFDTILYIDVLEHIEDDRAELLYAAQMLGDNGTLIVLSPAYDWLYTPFDKALGHFRRYTAGGLLARTPPDLKPDRLFYLDSIGLLSSLGNKFLLRQSLPTQWQILLWDRVLIPMSRVVDRIIRFRVGRSVVAIWRKKSSGGDVIR